jgi:uncharacterized protein YraI
MKRIVLVFLTLLIGTLGVLVLPAAAQEGYWTATYFGNASLSGSPTLIQGEYTTNLNYNWGAGSPIPSIPADNWSARWTGSRFLNAGNYRINVSADDGVRVYVDGVLRINEWHQASGQTYTADIYLGYGSHNFVVEFYEAGGLAFINYSLTAGGGPPPPPPPSGNTATILVSPLNVRNAPNPYYGAIIGVVYQGQVYNIVGRTADVSWIQINVNGLIGWVNRSYTYAPNAGNAPITEAIPPSTPTPVPYPPTPTPYPPPPSGGAYATINTTFLNLRDAPSAEVGRILRRLYRGEVYTVIGRNTDSSWLQIDANGLHGWINSSYVIGVNIQNVPVTQSGQRPTAGTATINSPRLNVRNAPGIYGAILTVVSRGDTYPLVGRNYNASWVQINVNGTIGWVNRGYVVLPGGFNVYNLPVTG